MLATANSEVRTLGASVLLHVGLLALLVAWKGFSPAPPQWVEIDLLAPRGQVESLGPAIPERRQSAKTRDIRKQAPTKSASEDAPTSKAEEFLNETGQASREPGRADGVEVSARERYLYELRLALERAKVYPPMAKRLGQQGRVMVKFQIDAHGRVTSAQVTEESAFPLLNEAAQKLVGSLSGLRPIPAEVGKSEWEFVLPVDYQL